MHGERAMTRPTRLRRTQAFTLIELLVVVAVIGVLFGAVLVVGTSVITAAKVRNTRVVLQIARDAVEEFKREGLSITTASQETKTAGRRVRYAKRYGPYPPDETEMFTAQGLPSSEPPPSNRSLSVGKAEFVPAPRGGSGYGPMQFYTAGNSAADLEHRDLVAMVLAIEMYSERAAVLLGGIPESNRSPGPLDPSGNPTQFLDRDEDKNGTWDEDLDYHVRYIVDSWGMPISYFAQRDYDPKTAKDTASMNAMSDWNLASTEMIRLNGGQPIIMSYGPSGPEQLNKDVQADPTASLVGDWAADHRINNPYNADNVYADPALKEKLAKGIITGP